LEKKYNVAVLALPFDVRDEKAVRTSIESIPADWKAIDILINNAGLAVGRDYFDEASLDDWNVMIDTNVKGFLYVAKAVSQIMVARKQGHIIIWVLSPENRSMKKEMSIVLPNLRGCDQPVDADRPVAAWHQSNFCQSRGRGN